MTTSSLPQNTSSNIKCRISTVQLGEDPGIFDSFCDAKDKGFDSGEGGGGHVLRLQSISITRNTIFSSLLAYFNRCSINGNMLSSLSQSTSTILNWTRKDSGRFDSNLRWLSASKLGVFGFSWYSSSSLDWRANLSNWGKIWRRSTNWSYLLKRSPICKDLTLWKDEWIHLFFVASSTWSKNEFIVRQRPRKIPQ